MRAYPEGVGYASANGRRLARSPLHSFRLITKGPARDAPAGKTGAWQIHHLVTTNKTAYVIVGVNPVSTALLVRIGCDSNIVVLPGIKRSRYSSSR